MSSSNVYIVGAGPGDPELLTVKALRLIQSAQTVVYDRLVSPEILNLIPAGATRIFAGKSTHHHVLPQSEINALLVQLALAGHSVVRLKGGDPFVFGRGSEEAEELARHGIAFEIVPGISAAASCSAYAGIPLTHRGLANSVRFLTGHGREGTTLDYDWAKLADADTTLVIYMGLANLGILTANLMSAGLQADTPAAAIENGTTPQQRVVYTTLARLARDVKDHGLLPPTLIVIGKVVSMAARLQTKEIPAHGWDDLALVAHA